MDPVLNKQPLVSVHIGPGSRSGSPSLCVTPVDSGLRRRPLVGVGLTLVSVGLKHVDLCNRFILS